MALLLTPSLSYKIVSYCGRGDKKKKSVHERLMLRLGLPSGFPLVRVLFLRPGLALGMCWITESTQTRRANRQTTSSGHGTHMRLFS